MIREALTQVFDKVVTLRYLGVLFIAFFLWRVKSTWQIYRNSPKGISITGTSLIFGKWVSSLRYITSASDIIGQAYLEASSTTTSSVPEEQLSFHAAMVDRLQHKYTMYGFEHNDVDPHNAIPVRTLKVLLRTNIPQLMPKLRPKIERAFQVEFDRGNQASKGVSTVSAFNISRRLTSKINNHVLVGNDLANNDEYIEAAIRYSEDVVIAMEICRQIPHFLVRFVAPTIMNWSGAMDRVAEFLRALIETRLKELEQQDKISVTHVSFRLDCVQWIINCSHGQKQRSLHRLVQQTIALLFASAHQMPMALVYAIYSACLHPEFIEPLRQEAQAGHKRHYTAPSRSTRLNPLDALSLQRKVLHDYTLDDGSVIPKGNLFCVPQQAMMKDCRNYSDPMKFDPSRYLVRNENGSLRAVPKLTDVKWSFPYWGGSKRACPGRWYVSAALKQVMSHMILTYDFQLENPNAPRTFSWTTALVPRTDVNILLRRRDISL
ncbi:cytochrome P450 [Halenospora varia]|nr:cytochrome P450 [Halenospora varia]